MYGSSEGSDESFTVAWQCDKNWYLINKLHSYAHVDDCSLKFVVWRIQQLLFACCFLKKIKESLTYSKTCVNWPLSKRPKIGFKDQLLLNAGQKYCRMTFIKLPFVNIKIFVFLFLSGRFTQVSPYCPTSQEWQQRHHGHVLFTIIK